MIFVELVFDVSADAREEVVELARRTTAATHREEGWVLYRFSTDVESPNRFVLTELWEDEEALKAHFAGHAFQSFFAELPSGGSFVSSRSWEGPLTPYSPPDPSVRPPA
jgi:quinol monooxygenase YgiN